MDADEELQEDFAIDWLPLDCIICICEWLTPDDLVQFSRACKLFYGAAQVGYLWRHHCLRRWTFCDVLQVAEGPHRWQRYFAARRKVEARMEQGRPGRDYRVKTLRGHESDITDAAIIGDSRVNWENPKPPLVISLSSNPVLGLGIGLRLGVLVPETTSDQGSVKAWDVLQAKPVWSQQEVLCMAADSSSSELATGKADGSITLWDVQDWKVKGVLKSTAGSVQVLKYGAAKKGSKLPQRFLLAYIKTDDSFGGNDQFAIWDPAKPDPPDEQAQQQPVSPAKPFLELWSSPLGLSGSKLNLALSSCGMLSRAGCGTEVPVWDLPSLIDSISSTPPHTPNVTLNSSNWFVNSCWLTPSCLATTCNSSFNVDIWDVGAHLEAIKKAGRSAMYDSSNLWNPTRTIMNGAAVTAMCVVAGLLVTGGDDGSLRLFNPAKGDCLQSFHDHKGAIMDIHADAFRVLTCSKDFSLRVYRWVKPQAKGSQPQLESRYTLLGGSVAHKTHDGFRRLLCEASSCVGIAGNQLKFYTFACKLDSP